MKNIMKKIGMFFVAVLIVAVFCFDGWDTEAENRIPENLYPTCGIVTELDILEDLVVFQDFAGNEWAFYGIEDWQTGDIVSAIMDDMHTENITDDEIVSARYSGHIQ